MKKSLITLLLLSLLVSGCGYRIGSIMHPQVKSIAIAPIKNETMEPDASALLRQALAEQFVVDGSLKVKSLQEADCIVYAQIKEVAVDGVVRTSRDSEMNFSMSEWRAKTKVEFTVIIPGRTKPLVSKRTVSGSANFQVLTDQSITRQRGVQQSLRDVADKVVQSIVEAW